MASILRLLGRAWAGSDGLRTALIDSLAILPVDHKAGHWRIRLLATPGHEVVTRVAAVADTDLRGTPLLEASPPALSSKLDYESSTGERGRCRVILALLLVQA